MRGKAGPRPNLLGETEPKPEASLLFDKLRVKKRGDSKREATITFCLVLRERERTVGLPEEAVAALRSLFAAAEIEKLELTAEAGPYNMRCRSLPAASGARTAEQLLRSVRWTKLKLLRADANVELWFTAVIDVDTSVWEWLYDAMGTEIFVELEEAEPELPGTRVVMSPPAPGGPQ